jgi:2-dehydro-3-deoxygalactonokinase
MQKIFCDWGTSNLRAYLVDDGIVLKDYASNCGILKAKEIGFEKVLHEIFWEFQCAKDTPAILSGMVGAKQGWCEAPYVPTPLNYSSLTMSFVEPKTVFNVKILGGVNHLDESSNYEVMRGEEVQVFGVVDHEPNTELICLPGSHSKWVEIKEGRIIGFRTWMTGELFKTLSEKTIFKSQIQSKDYDRESFVQGVEFAREHNELGSSLFKLRTEFLFDRVNQNHFYSYLSGFLIGSEIREAIGTHKSVSLCGSDFLMKAYEQALKVFALSTKQYPSAEATIRGIEKICRDHNE